jgi:outer membrane translocation and assembly module TamA
MFVLNAAVVSNDPLSRSVAVVAMDAEEEKLRLKGREMYEREEEREGEKARAEVAEVREARRAAALVLPESLERVARAAAVSGAVTWSSPKML